ncbi:MAG: 2-oxoacid:acceptor oxidoreductase family protein [Candidatus ainarchaeum sp.]|nr:2-oxoacid:acceptor oxidoreductase family protein [Candidatus ainarchaeum sp.]MDD3975683.1 2-oxoacid:acceptor oxidoreductase family protein [Candidatus ainarchaeum sp.]
MNQKSEIIFYGRGGLGAKTAAQILAEAANIEEKNIQAFPEYGPERRGAPVRSFVRISDKHIRVHEPILNPDYIVVIDSNLFDVIENLKEFNGTYIINTNKPKDYFKKILKNKKFILIDGTKIALENLKINNPNIVLIGALIKQSKIIKLSSVEKIIEEEFTKKGKEYFIKPNLKCLNEGYNYNFKKKK